jgi:hypothetical protein
MARYLTRLMLFMAVVVRDSNVFLEIALLKPTAYGNALDVQGIPPETK